MFILLIFIFPCFGVINPVIRLKIVDLPTPFGPSIPKIWPSFILKLILSSDFRHKIKNLNGPLFAASPSEEIYNEIIKFNFSEKLIKNFYDLEKNE